MNNLNDFYRLFPSRPVVRTVAAPAATPVAAAQTPANDPDMPAANRYRERDFGTGYGRSSGYAQDRRYTAGRGDRMLRVG